jgi:hypothetical protein
MHLKVTYKNNSLLSHILEFLNRTPNSRSQTIEFPNQIPEPLRSETTSPIPGAEPLSSRIRTLIPGPEESSHGCEFTAIANLVLQGSLLASSCDSQLFSSLNLFLLCCFCSSPPHAPLHQLFLQSVEIFFAKVLSFSPFFGWGNGGKILGVLT